MTSMRTRAADTIGLFYRSASQRACALAWLMVAAGCATTGPAPMPVPSPPAPPPQAPPVPRNVEPPAPKVNLSGFPLPYRQGYADGCASVDGVERKDAARFSADMNYRTGWTDGRALCAKK